MTKDELIKDYRRSRASELAAKQEVHRLERVIKRLNQETIIAFEDKDILTYKLAVAEMDIEMLLKCDARRRCFYCKWFQGGANFGKCDCKNPEWRGTVPHIRERLRKARTMAMIIKKTGGLTNERQEM